MENKEKSNKENKYPIGHPFYYFIYEEKEVSKKNEEEKKNKN